MTANAGAIPVTVLTGFLGAGKTTLLNRLLPDPALAATAVIVNEFGDIGLDHLLIEAVDGDRLILTTGCICCAARGDLLEAVDGLLARRRDGRLAFDRIVIETTGLADPGPILNALLIQAARDGAARIDGVVTLVSALDGAAVMARHDEARRQVAFADRLLITKADLLTGGPADAPTALAERLAALNPSAPIAEVEEGGPLIFDLAAPVIRSRPAGPHHHHHAADARIRAVTLAAGPVDAAHLSGFLALLQERFGSALLRVKGIAALRHDPDRPLVIQAVGHLLHPATRLAAWPGPDRSTRLVVILDGADPAAVTSLWDDVFGPPAIDRPDAAALLPGQPLGAGLFA